jgi:hypothetical protein
VTCARLAAAVLASCACSSAWHVPEGHEARFREAQQVCRALTDADDGSLRAEAYERCLERRGWRHQRFYEGR